MDSLSNILHSIKAGEFGLTEFFISILFSIFAGFLCMYLYRIYFTEAHERNESLTRSFLIIAPSVCSMFWAIQYSLPLSLGLLGALSFVRFRTPIKKPEDIAFILLVIALALLSSVFRFFAAIILISLVAALIVLRTILTNKKLFTSEKTSMILFLTVKSGNMEEIDKKVLAKLTDSFPGTKANIVLKDAVQKDTGFNLRYSLLLKDKKEGIIPKVYEELKKIEGIDRIEIFHEQAAL